MKEIVCTLLTSEGCGHCSHFRGNGILGNKKQFNTYDFLNKHLKPNGITKDITFLNIHLWFFPILFNQGYSHFLMGLVRIQVQFPCSWIVRKGEAYLDSV